MPEFTQTNIENILDTCRQNIETIAQSLNQCFDSKYRVELGDSQPWNPDDLPGEFNGPGLAVTFVVSGYGMVCLIPETLPLPEWYTKPSDSEESRLQTLAMEWPMNILPIELEAEEFHSRAVEDLNEEIVTSEPLNWTVVQELLLFEENDTASGEAEKQTTPESASETESSSGEEPTIEAANTDAEPSAESDEPSAEEQESTAESVEAESDKAAASAKILIIWPVSQPKSPNQTESGEKTEASSNTENAETAEAATEKPSIDKSPEQHLMGMPVTVMVRLAEKRIELGALLSLTPGALITFNKSCEDLLDLYVNNQLYCRGEAIKIDEKFGIKINEIDISPEQKKNVIGI